MLSYRLKYRKNTESKNPKVVRTKSGRIMILSKYLVRNSKKEARRLLSSLRIRTLLSQILLLF